jgi:hypothetical protein
MRLTQLSQEPESSRDEIEKEKNTYLALVGGNLKLPVGPKKRVSFSQKVDIKMYLSRTDMKREEVEASWFSIEEFKAIHASCTKEVIRGAKGRHMDNVKHCVRGLETYLPLARTFKERNRSTATDAVLDTQERYRYERPCNYEEAIWRAYHQASACSTLWARRCGVVDKNEADAIYDELKKNYIKRTECSRVLANTMVVGLSTTPPPHGEDSEGGLITFPKQLGDTPIHKYK